MDPRQPSNSEDTYVTVENVGLAFSFIVLNAVICKILGLKLSSSLVTGAVRCVLQLSLLALILQKVFEANNPWAVASIACTYSLCGSDAYGVTDGFISLRFTQRNVHDRNWCVVSPLFYSHGVHHRPLATIVIVKSQRRCDNMVSPLLLGDDLNSWIESCFCSSSQCSLELWVQLFQYPLSVHDLS